MFGRRHIGHTLVVEMLKGKSYESVVMCESNARKQLWLKCDPGCIFDNIVTMSSNPHCVVHNRPCSPAEKASGARVVICGWSCKDLSTCNKNFKSRGGVLEAGKGTSGSTFHGLLSVLDALATLTIYIGENVKDISLPSSENRAFLYEALSSRGWVADLRLLQATDYGARVQRARAWIIAVHAGRLGITVEAARHLLCQIFAVIDRLKVPPPLELEAMLLKDTDVYVKKHMAAVKASSEQALSASSRASGSGEWQRQLAKTLAEAGMRWSECVPSPEKTKGSIAYAALPSREKLACGLTLATSPGLFCVDVSQTIGRLYTSDDRALPCITPEAKIMLLQRKPMRLLLGVEALMLHGASRAWLQRRLDAGDFSDSFLLDLAGNSFVGYVFAACLLAILATGPPLASPVIQEDRSSESDILALVDTTLGL